MGSAGRVFIECHFDRGGQSAQLPRQMRMAEIHRSRYFSDQ